MYQDLNSPEAFVSGYAKDCMNKMYKIIIVALLIAFCLPVSRARAWWAQGHQTITTGAISHLPQPLKSFFSHNSATIINDSGNEPTPSYSHYIDIDWYSEFAAGTFPHDENVLIAKYGLSTVQNNGDGPWALANTEQQLSSLMRSAKTTQDWINLLSTAGALAHFAEDLHNPMHLAKNYNGQLTGQTGLHSRYEGDMLSTPSSRYAQLAPVANPAGCRYLTSVIDATFDEINVDYPYNSSILSGDLAARAKDSHYGTTYYNAMWNSCGAFTIQLFQAASERVASVWYTAWVDAGSPIPPCYYTLRGDLNGDCTVDFLDLAILSEQWLNTCDNITWCNKADINHSNAVDFSDFAIMASNWLVNCYDVPTSTACTP